MQKTKLLIFVLFVLFCMGGCGKQADIPSSDTASATIDYFDSTLPDSAIILTVPHMTLSSFKYIVPLGNLNPPDHTLPTDHVYYVHDDTSETIPVYAPADGKIVNIYTFNYGTEHDNRLIIGTNKHYSYYLIHLVASSSLKVGDIVTAGQELGVASKHAAAVDIGVLNNNISQPFINTDHYVTTSLYSDAPLKYYTEPVKSQLYALVRRVGSDKDGTFCYDQAGKLVGGWFQEGVTNADITSGTSVGTKEIAFAYDNYDPTQINVSIGGTVFTKGVYFVQNGATDPASVSSSSGKIVYKLYLGSSEATRSGILIAQMQTDGKVKIEAFSDTTSDSADFTSSAYTYTR